ncbi:3807_t:CDS:2, partial [Dentiscutata heterogama]
LIQSVELNQCYVTISIVKENVKIMKAMPFRFNKDNSEFKTQ